MREFWSVTAFAIVFFAIATLSPYGKNLRIWVLFEGEDALQLANQCSRPSPGPVGGTWKPTKTQILELESRLPHVISSELTNKKLNGEFKPYDYFRQFAGLIVAEKKVIYVNGIHREAFGHEAEEGSFWWQKPLIICDGGAIAFGVEYKPDTSEFDNFSFNGTFAGPT